MKEIYRFIKIICNDLKIKKPNIQLINKLEGTQLACYMPYRDNLLIKKEYENQLDLFFAIAHELRHKYQIEYKIFNFKNYKTSHELSINDYNLQEEEIDANAYAYLIILSYFKIEALFNGLDSEIKRKIIDRAKEIYKK